MAKRKHTVTEILAAGPWWYGFLAAFAAYLLLAAFIPAFLQGGTPRQGIADGLFQVAMLAGLMLLVPLPFALFNGLRASKLSANRRGEATIRGLSWRRFQERVAEVYRRQGYTVRERIAGAADGGVDLRLERGGRVHLVQCKYWKTRRVGVPAVREIYRLMTDQGAVAASLVTAGTFTIEAQKFARDKAIDLVDGDRLASLMG